MCRPWVDLTVCKEAPELDFFTDASGGKETGGCGGMLQNEWFKATWNPSFMEEKNPSIAYLELFALVSAVIIWKVKLANSRFTMFCDNQAVVEMVNNLTSGCQNCMYLLWILVKTSLLENFRIFAKYIRTDLNGRADALSRNDYDRFIKISEQMRIFPDRQGKSLPEALWPPEKIWID